MSRRLLVLISWFSVVAGFRVCVVHSLVHCIASSVPALFPLGAFLLNHTDPANPAHLRQYFPVY